MENKTPDDNQQFAKLCTDFSTKKVDSIIMHIDTVKILTTADWEKLEAAGVSTVTLSRTM